MAIAVAAVALASASVAGQGPAGQKPAAPAKTWQPSRTVDGQPDVQGFWAAVGGGVPFFHNIQEGTNLTHAVIQGQKPVRRSLVIDPPEGKIPYTPWAAAIYKHRYDHTNNPQSLAELDPVARCFLSGVPRIQHHGGFQLLQPPGYVVLLYSFAHTYRIIPLDGRLRLSENIKLWMGDSRGRWEGTTLVVEIANHNGKTWFDWAGNFHSDAARIVERFSFADANRIDYTATFHDPKAYTRPWTLGETFARNKEDDYEQWEDACFEGNKAPELMLHPDSTEKPGVKP